MLPTYEHPVITQTKGFRDIFRKWGCKDGLMILRMCNWYSIYSKFIVSVLIWKIEFTEPGVPAKVSPFNPPIWS